MSISRAVVFLYFPLAASAASALGCGLAVAPERAEDAGNAGIAPGGGGPDGSPEGGSERDAATVGWDGSLPAVSTCTVTISGAFSASWTSDSPGASLTENFDDGDPYITGGDLIQLGCGSDQNGASNLVVLNVHDVTAPGTYTADVLVNRVCSPWPACDAGVNSSWDANSACTLTVDTFAPATRGGLSGHYVCAPVSDGVVGDMQTITVSGSFAFAPTTAPLPSALADAGDAAAFTPTACTLHITGAAGTYDAREVGLGWAWGDGDIWCEGVGGSGDYYMLTIGPDAQESPPLPDSGVPPAQATLSLSEATFCPGDCSADYETFNPCTIDVLVNEGDGGRYKANFDCEGLDLPGIPDDAGTAAVRIVGSIDGVFAPPPPPE